MKNLLLLITWVCLTFQVIAQHPLVGTWEMLSVKGIDADGNAFFLDTTSVRETKIITPTHYMLIACDVEADSLIFNRAMAGQVRLDGDSYIEIPTQASVQIFENVKVNFTWKVEGDVFTQSGTIMRPDGKTITLEALTFQRVRNAAVHSTNPAIGTWNQIFADYKGGDGKINPSFDKKTDTGMLIVTPTHWMRIDHNKNKFARASYGTYAFDGAGLFINIVFSSDPFRKGARLPLTQKFEGNKLEITSQGQTPAGTPAMVTDKFEKAQ